MKPKALVTGCLVLAMLVLPAALWAQTPPAGEMPPPPPPTGDDGGMLPPPPPGGDDAMAPPPGGPGDAPGPMPPLPAQLDTDKNGVVSAEEFTNGWKVVTENRFKRLDTDGDGNLSTAELDQAPGFRGGRRGMGRGFNPGADMPPPPPGGGMGQCPPNMQSGGPQGPMCPLAEQCDANGDGAVTEAEFLDCTQKNARIRFKELDTDGDGTVTVEQLRQMQGPRGGMHGPGRGMHGPGGGMQGPGGPGGMRGPGGGMQGPGAARPW